MMKFGCYKNYENLIYKFNAEFGVKIYCSFDRTKFQLCVVEPRLGVFVNMSVYDVQGPHKSSYLFSVCLHALSFVKSRTHLAVY